MSELWKNKLFIARVRQYCVDFLVEQGWGTNGFEVHEQWMLDTAMRAMRLSFKCPAVVLADDREIARYPATLWSHLLHSIGLRKYARYTRVLLNECLAFPSVEVPPQLKVGMKVCFDYRTVLEQ